MPMSLYVSRPNDLFPVIRWVPPQFTLWIRLDSTDQRKVAKGDAKVNGGVETLGVFVTIYGGKFTCSVVPVPLMPPLS